MSHDIPTTPQADPAETIMAAVAHGMEGHPEKAVPLFEPFITSGATTAVGLCAALAEMSAFGPRRTLPKDGTFGLLVLDATDGTPGDINELPAGVRFAAQFSTAWGNGDKDTAYALFHALVHDQTEQQAHDLAIAIQALFEMAVISLREMTGHKPTA